MQSNDRKIQTPAYELMCRTDIMATRHDKSPTALATTRHRQAMANRKRGTGVTPRIRKAVETLVFGFEGMPPSEAVTMTAAAKHVGLSPRAFRMAFTKPAVMALFQEQINLLRTGERVANIRAAIEIRDDPTLKQSPAGQKVRLNAAKQLDADLEKRPDAPAVNINVRSPGIVIRLKGRDRALEAPTHGKTIEHQAHVAEGLTANSEDTSDV